jgi:spore maturation protein CgeB
LPVDASRVRFAPGGSAAYRLHRGEVPLDLAGPALARALAPARGASAVLVLGVGLGEAVEACLDDPGVLRVSAWDRDPWLLRLLLMRSDRSADLRRGRLRLALAADLLDLPPARAAKVEHPLLGRLYARELDWPRGALPERRAVLCAGGLFVEDLGRALALRGFALWTLELEALAREELDRTLRRIRPELVAAINYTGGLAELCAEHRVPLLCWEIDPATSPPRRPACATDHVFLFTYRRAHVADWRAAGFERVEHLPLAADPETRRPLALGDEERVRYSAPLSFVGSSMHANARRLERRFADLWARCDPRADPERGRALLQEVLAEQLEDLTRFVVPALLERRAPGFVAAARAEGEDPVVLAGEIAASEKRLRWAARLGPLGLCVWGDDGWRRLEPAGVRALGPAGHREELSRVYNGSDVNVDIGRLFQSDVVPMRVFDVLACGRPLLTERTPELAELFGDGVEVATYRGPDELVERARRLLDRPEEALAMGRRGRETVLARHTIDRRLAHMLAALAAVRV